MLTPGTHVGRYEIQHQLAIGATGTVCRASDPQLGRTVALVLLPADANGVAPYEQVARPARAAATLVHPNIVRVLDYGEHGGQPYLVTEYVAGENLAEIIGRGAAVPLTDRLRWMEELCEGIAYAHQHGVIHGAITPASLIVGPGGRLRIFGFGVAGATPDSGVIGLPHYLAPEQLRGDVRIDARADVFAVGAVCYELVTWRKAFPGPDRSDVRRQVLTAGAAPILDIAPGTNTRLVTAIEHALHQDPAERVVDVAALRLALQHVRASMEPETDRRRELGSDTVPELMPPPAAAPTARRPISAPGPGSSHEAQPARRRQTPENVQFTVYRPNLVRPGEWKTLLAFMHLSDLPPDAPPDQQHPRARVDAIAQQLLGDEVRQFGPVTADGRQRVPRESEITFVPVVAGVEFDPPQRTFRWVRDVHQETFQLRADAALDGKVAAGHLSVFLGVVLLADVNIAIAVERAPTQHQRVERATAAPFRKIFACYSHMDEEIVRQFEAFVESLGDRYLRDVRDLRAGEDWDTRLLSLIEEADVFQLFWSTNAMRSPYVRREWEHALALNRTTFVRPTYWETPIPESPAEGLPPEALRRLHFHRLGLPVAPPQPTWARRPATAGSPLPSAPVRSRSQLRVMAGVATAAVALLAIWAVGLNLPTDSAPPPPTDIATTPEPATDVERQQAVERLALAEQEVTRLGLEQQEKVAELARLQAELQQSRATLRAEQARLAVLERGGGTISPRDPRDDERRAAVRAAIERQIAERQTTLNAETRRIAAANADAERLAAAHKTSQDALAAARLFAAIVGRWTSRADRTSGDARRIEERELTIRADGSGALTVTTIAHTRSGGGWTETGRESRRFALRADARGRVTGDVTGEITLTDSLLAFDGSTFRRP